MTTLCYKMLGRVVQVEYGADPYSVNLMDELFLYPISQDIVPDVIFRIGPHQVHGALSNPKIHSFSPGSMLADMHSVIVKWNAYTHPFVVNLSFKKSTRNNIINPLRRFLDRQYALSWESAGQIFHELVLVPSVYFIKNLVLVHASAMISPEGQGILVGGTGGVGKTSLELELIMHRKWRFLADDIAFLTGSGQIYANLAYPKIYAYNVRGSSLIRKKLLSGRSVLDRIQWSLRSRISLSGVRRRVNPKDFYEGRIAQEGKLKAYFILSREECNSIEIQGISPELATILSVEVMKAEYWVFHQHLYWHRFNALLAGAKTIIDFDDILNRWGAILKQAFSEVPCFVIRIPTHKTHNEITKYLVNAVEKIINV
ncbi:MAG: hypothetical protein K8R75_08490 [Deltaproteobacteria bacterium]|nr:hypothetical protein [Deltaproteobacteria bacterium]